MRSKPGAHAAHVGFNMRALEVEPDHHRKQDEAREENDKLDAEPHGEHAASDRADDASHLLRGIGEPEDAAAVFRARRMREDGVDQAPKGTIVSGIA